MTQFYHSADGLRLAYKTIGTGPQVLCLAGLTRNFNDFQYLAQKCPHLQLICPDYRGRGQSDWDPEPEHYAVPFEVSDCVALLDHLHIDQIPIIGTSRGGIIASFMPQERVSAIIFNDIGPIIERAGLIIINDLIGKNPFAKNYEEMAALLQGYMIGFDGVPFSRWLQEARIHFKLVDDCLKINYDPKLSVAFNKTFEAGEFDLSEQFKSLKDKPMGIIRGANSNILDITTVNLMRDWHPNLQSVEVPNRGHIPFLDEDESIYLIYQVLSQLPDFQFLKLE